MILAVCMCLLLGSTAAWAGDEPADQPAPAGDAVSSGPDLEALLAILFFQSAGEPFSLRVPQDGGPVEVRVSSDEQAWLAREVLKPLPAQIVEIVVGAQWDAHLERFGDDYIFSYEDLAARFENRTGAWGRGCPGLSLCSFSTGLESLRYAPTLQDVGPDWARITIALALATAALAWGGVYWRRRIGLSTYVGILSLSVGLLVLGGSVLADPLLNGQPGFGVHQQVGVVLGLAAADVGVLLLRRHPTPIMRSQTVLVSRIR